MKTQIAKWGNSMAVRIPKSVAQAAKLRPGDHLELAVEGSGVVTIRKKKGAASLKDLLHGMTSANLHGESDWAVSAGEEQW